MPADVIGNSIMVLVPVERFEIDKGPDAKAWVVAYRRLHENPRRHVRASFTLRTAASPHTFLRSLYLATIMDVGDDTYTFTAFFYDHIVSGTYSTKDCTGFFTLE